ncbi:type IV toxin-antitoxin system AbiEi family antitoxin domain-containing protein [Pseudactinotalea sp. HY158]|uniref:type IV toxin-antitoxin system AbiEi family antitoxin domain-containing protein n=1 Tax=Pseudactinotalea sp. HY158 TaxID=2654547 RepID=UPI00129CCCC2|nr:type IV toxin-antitoxin system AbiEi family antitoxin domain-containing protein [Pseudactinotalea sp. HY158]QGH69768.1 hypothetical protein GCE65_09780 [Pseudactinotalea sp. HY158]
MRTDLLVTVGELAADQWGLLTTRQAVAHGLTRLHLSRLVERGLLDRVSHGVYAQPVALADPNVDLRAEWLALKPEATAAERLQNAVTTGVVSHASAAGLHDLGSLLSVDLHYTLPRPYRSRKVGVRIHRADLMAEDVLVVAGLPVTTIARTITDLLMSRHDLEHVAQILREAIATRRMTIADLHAAAGRRPDSPRVRPLIRTLLGIAELDEGQVLARALGNPLVQQVASEYAREVSRLQIRALVTTKAHRQGPAAAPEAQRPTMVPPLEHAGMPDLRELERDLAVLKQVRPSSQPARWSEQITKVATAMARKHLTDLVVHHEPDGRNENAIGTIE